VLQNCASLARRTEAVLPPSTGDLTADGGLNLSHNQLASLPESVGSLAGGLAVGGDLNLYDNPVEEFLPRTACRDF